MATVQWRRGIKRIAMASLALWQIACLTGFTVTAWQIAKDRWHIGSSDTASPSLRPEWMDAPIAENNDPAGSNTASPSLRPKWMDEPIVENNDPAGSNYVEGTSDKPFSYGELAGDLAANMIPWLIASALGFGAFFGCRWLVRGFLD